MSLLTLQIIHTEPLEVHQLQFSFSYPGIGSHGSFCPLSLYSSKLSLPVFTYLSNLKTAIYCASLLLLQIQESY